MKIGIKAKSSPHPERRHHSEVRNRLMWGYNKSVHKVGAVWNKVMVKVGIAGL